MGIMFVIGPGIKNIFIALGLLTWVRTARMIRGQILQLKEKEYVEAAKAQRRHSFPYNHKAFDSELYFYGYRSCNAWYSKCDYVECFLKLPWTGYPACRQRVGVL